METGRKNIVIAIATAITLIFGIFINVPRIVHAEENIPEAIVTLEGLEWECNNPDRNNLGNGDEIKVTAAVKNNSSENVTVNPEECLISWEYEELEEGTYSGTGVDGSGETFILSPGAAADITFLYSIGRFEVMGIHTFTHLKIVASGGYKIDYELSTDGFLDGYVTDAEGTMHKADQFEYAGNMDFTVSSSEGTDFDPPVIYSMTATSETVEPSGEVTYQLELGDCGPAEPTSIWVVFQDVSDEQNSVEIGASIEELGEGFYTGTFALESKLRPGTYKITQINIYDEAFNMSVYRLVGTTLEDYSDHTLSVADLVVSGSYDVFGDINGDGVTNMQDLMLCMNHIVGRTALEGEPFNAADVNGNGRIEMGDAMKIMNRIVGKE